MKTLRIILIALLVLYGIGSLAGTLLALNPSKQAEVQKLGELTPGTEKVILLSAGMLAGQVWLYFSAIALLFRNMKEGYMYAVTLGFIELIQAIVIIAALGTHNFGSPANYFALIKGGLLLAVALIAFKKSTTTVATQ